ncbi:sigma-70 family RNA polymerase sigma factor [Desulfosporosinus sp.]|uniref:RNA polymerase sigma factor n=1 Tax=Desulfosporosinus sp. TaxID=157907 RepID=UPI0025BDBE89|nr:sigma-70 family RNA polymerase sigma factor [Desulfosporosinus sp.]
MKYKRASIRLKDSKGGERYLHDNEAQNIIKGDEELIQAILAGNGEGYADIVERYQTGLFRTAYYYTQNVEDARDLTQDIFIKAYNNLTVFRQGSAFSTWLYRIAVNHCLDWCRKKKPQYVEASCFDNLCTEEDSPEDLFLQQEIASEVQTAVASLPPIYSTVLILYYFQDFSPQQIAEITDAPKRTVETRLFRGRKMLREKLHSMSSGGEGHDLLSKPG